MIYLLSKKVTSVIKEPDHSIYRLLFHQLEDFNELLVQKVSRVSSLEEVKDKFKSEDKVVFFNELKKEDYTEEFQEFVKEIEEKRAGNDRKYLWYSIALDDKRRDTSLNIREQSFDMKSESERRALQESDVMLAGVLFKKLVVDTYPTLYNKKMKYFASHKRADAEKIVEDIYKKLSFEKLYVDLREVGAGENAQDEIEKNLRASDILLYFQTPKGIDAPYIDKELAIALAYNIPILWIQLGDVSKQQLNIKPLEKPHFIYSNFDLENETLSLEDINEIIFKSFEIVKEQKNIIVSKIKTLKNGLKKNGYEYKKLDSLNLLHLIEKKREKGFYCHRNYRYILQHYGRNLVQEDLEKLKSCLKEKKYIDVDEGHGPYYDSLICTSQNYTSEENICDNLKIYGDRVENVESKIVGRKIPKKISFKKGIIISGAFTNSIDTYQQELIDAIFILIEKIYRIDGKIIFGSHPTFQSLIVEKGRIEKDSLRDYLTMYISKYFEKFYNLKLFSDYVTIKEIEKIEGEDENKSREASLKKMREEMINDSDAVAMICLGGKTLKENPNPGVDEEIRIAKERGLDIFVIGSVGGRTGELVNDFTDTEIESLNGMSVEENKEIFNNNDYNLIFDKILEYIIEKNR